MAALPATGNTPCSRFRRANMSIVSHTGRRNMDEVSLRRGMFSYGGSPIGTELLDHLKPKHARKGDSDEVLDTGAMTSMSVTASSGFGRRTASTPDLSQTPKKSPFFHPLGLKTDSALKRTCFEAGLKGDDFLPGINAKIRLAEVRMRERMEERLQEQREERIERERRVQELVMSQGTIARLPVDPHPWPGPSTPGRSHISGFQGMTLKNAGASASPPGSAKTWVSSSPSDVRPPPSRQSLSSALSETYMC